MSPDVDNAVKQLLLLQTQARIRRTTPFDLNPTLFKACINLVNAQDVPTRLAIYNIFNPHAVQKGIAANANNRHRPGRKVTSPSSDGAEETSTGRANTSGEDRQTLGVRV